MNTIKFEKTAQVKMIAHRGVSGLETEIPARPLWQPETAVILE